MAHLWSDEEISNLLETKTSERVIITDIRDSYERALAAQLAFIEIHFNEQNSRIAELERKLQEAAQWRPVVEDEDVPLYHAGEKPTGEMSTMYEGTAFLINHSEDAWFLPEGYAICKKVQE